MAPNEKMSINNEILEVYKLAQVNLKKTGVHDCRSFEDFANSIEWPDLKVFHIGNKEKKLFTLNNVGNPTCQIGAK